MVGGETPALAKIRRWLGGKGFQAAFNQYVFIAVGATMGSLKRWNRAASRRSMFVAFVLASLKFALLIFRLPLADWAADSAELLG